MVLQTLPAAQRIVLCRKRRHFPGQRRILGDKSFNARLQDYDRSRIAGRGFRGFPVATVAFYGPDDTRATKLTVGIVPAENAEVTDLRRWFAEAIDIRDDTHVAKEVLAFIEAAGARSVVMTEAGARSVVMTDRIIGCPHEEGIDCEGPTCPHGPFWAGRDRWTGKCVH